MSNEIIKLKVDGMDCSNCATSISRFLERKGLEEVYVNFQTKEVRFKKDDEKISLDKITAGIHKLGYVVMDDGTKKSWWSLKRKLWFSALFTVPLLLQHLLMMAGIHLHWMENPWVQFAFCLPVFAIGVAHFGVSGWKSLRGGVPNMDVLIIIGSSAAFIYSLVGTLTGQADYIFYETAATIITLVLVGNWLEKRAVEQTTTSIGELTKLQVETARQVMPSGTVVTIDARDIKKGNILQVNEGDKIPADGVIISGNATIDESMLTGESLPIDKNMGDGVVGASLLVSGNFQMEVKATGEGSVLGQMIELVKMAQADKPDIQRLADKISAIFVPAVILISLGTILIGHFVFGLSFQQALMNGIAVLVISCPCAMGLATPTAVMVGVGRMAKNGILVKGGQTLEIFAKIKNIVFDKTGTLTTGAFKLKDIQYFTADQNKVHAMIYLLEKHSSHPIARSLVKEMENRKNGSPPLELKVSEHRGSGLEGVDPQGNVFRIGSGRPSFDGRPINSGAHIYLTENDQLLAALEITDDIKEKASEVVAYLKANDIRPYVLSGDKVEKTASIAKSVGIPDYFGEQLPNEKLEVIGRLSQKAYTAMVGDGINDAPALAKATIGISMSNASQAAIQTAQIVLLNGNLEHLKQAHAISKHTLLTIKQNLFWAFAYNVVAIPVAAMGFLNPMWGALFMAFSDVVVIGNSIRLKRKRIFK
ncbi:MAG: cation-translocating P-type ATPase [Saprospiraceae bacterium]|nr:cation-translocating P-type ATPase [Saprospiraceae bacterium]MCB9322598.1 cation-translocating P-type ATPase [Lewinellaceae bacterium]